MGMRYVLEADGGRESVLRDDEAVENPFQVIFPVPLCWGNVRELEDRGWIGVAGG